MTDSPELRISLEDDDWVVISATENVTPGDWDFVDFFWSSVLGHEKSIRSIRIPLNDFIERISWLREVWRPRGGSYSSTPEVVAAAKAVKSGSSDFKALIGQNPNRHANALVSVPGLKLTRNLTPRQHENVLYLLEMKNGANFSVPGAGKTLTALCVWSLLRSAGSVDRLLVICPKSSFESWETEPQKSFDSDWKLEQYAGDLFSSDPDIGLVNFEQLENPFRTQYLRNWVQKHSSLVVVDEAHRIKSGRGSVRWTAVQQITRVARRVDILTGTPMPQSPADLRSIFSAGWTQLTREDLDERLLPYLRRNTVFVRTTKGELELPEATPVIVSQAPSPLHEAVLSALRERYVGPNFLSVAEERNLAKRGKAVMTMLAAATNPGLLVNKDFTEIEMGLSWPPRAVSQDAALTDVIHNFISHEIPWKFKYVALRSEELSRSGEKLLVWSNFIGNLGALKAVLKKFSPAVVYGNVSAESRRNEIRRFREDPKCSVLISNPQTLAEGISLHEVCHSEIFVDRSYNAGLYLQAVDRIHRLGLDKDQKTSIEILVTKGSIDERVATRLDAKINALSKFLQDEHLAIASIPQSDEMAPNQVLGLDEADFEDIARFWGITHG